VPPAAVRASPLARQRRRTAYLFVLPMVGVLALVAGWPLVRTVYFAFTDAALNRLEDHAFIGVANFAALARDPDWWRAVWNTVFFTMASVSLEVVLGLIIALTLDARLAGRGLLRAAVLIPWAIPTIVSAQMWNWMYNDLYGVLNHVFLGLGLIDAPKAWTADPGLVMWAVIAVDVWKTTPFMALLILAALQALPPEIYEAARVDGVSPVKLFFLVTLPLIGPGLMVAVIFRSLDAMRVFDLMYVLTGNNRATASMSVYARQHLVDFQDLGYGSAASTFVFLIIAAFTVLYLAVGRARFAPEGGRP
jgi:trehalose/maltose transport system permease protein